MAEQPQIIHGIQWRQTLPVTHIFRSFRIAIHPSKVLLALVALLLVYVTGRGLDAVWPNSERAVPNEIASYEQFQSQPHPGGITFGEFRADARANVDSAYASELLAFHIEPNRSAALKAAQKGDDLNALRHAILAARKHKADAALAQCKAAVSGASGMSNAAERHRAIAQAKLSCDHDIEGIYQTASQQYQLARQVKLEGLFAHYFQYESNQISNVVRGVRSWNWLGQGWGTQANAINLPQNPLASPQAGVSDSDTSPGVLVSVYRFFAVGPVWLLSQHVVFFVVFGIIFLAIWAIFGGAISRIAAVHVARDEKLSIRSALMFSINKFLSFLFAPLIPIIIVVVIGGIVTLAALAVGNIPVVGPIIIGIFFFLVLIAGFVMALVVLGLFGGLNMMYPTVAVEGSDSFDAISRSFSYLYARPWRMGFYTLVAVVYGALTYLFVRLFIYLMLVLAHKFVGFGILVHASNAAPLWSMMWPSPSTASRLSYQVDFLTLNTGQSIGAFLVSIWVYLVIAMMGAFAISFYFSSSTIIYFLMRKEVDATEMDDVYLEQVDDDFGDESPLPGTDATPPAPADVPPVTAPAEPSADGVTTDNEAEPGSIASDVNPPT